VTTRVALPVATAFGVGYVPIAPGTFGSLAGLVLWVALPASTAMQAVAVVTVFVAGSWSAGVAERHFGRTDPSQVVIDEVLGMLMTLFLNPVRWRGAILAFFLFRIADVIKPFPANRLERLPRGLGVMADDAMAAVYANLALRFSIWSFGHLGIWSLLVQLTSRMAR
jgi:phosphatidylglycerophosphatase A